MSLFTIFLCTATGSCIALSPPTAASKCHDALLGRVMLETPRCNHRTTISLTRSSEQISRRIFTPSAVVRAIARVDRVSSASSAVALPAAVAEFVVLAFVAFFIFFRPYGCSSNATFLRSSLLWTCLLQPSHPLQNQSKCQDRHHPLAGDIDG